MDKFINFVRDGGMKLPPGFRFQPTDEELVFQYRKCKVFSLPLPTSITPDLNVWKFDPWDLPGELKQERYFFSSKEAKYGNGKRINRATSSGYWKVTGSDKQIVSPRSHEMVGMRKTLVFHEGKPPYPSRRTNWIMHEYRLVLKQQHRVQEQVLDQASLNDMERWILCRIFLKKRRTDEEEINDGICRSERMMMGQARYSHFIASDEYNSANESSSSSSSSFASSRAVTEASSAGLFENEESSSCSIVF